MSRPGFDPEVAATLVRRGEIFKLVEDLRGRGRELTVKHIKAAMKSAGPDKFKQADYLWVDTTLAKRL